MDFTINGSTTASSLLGPTNGQAWRLQGLVCTAFPWHGFLSKPRMHMLSIGKFKFYLQLSGGFSTVTSFGARSPVVHQSPVGVLGHDLDRAADFRVEV